MAATSYSIDENTDTLKQSIYLSQLNRRNTHDDSASFIGHNFDSALSAVEISSHASNSLEPLISEYNERSSSTFKQLENQHPVCSTEKHVPLLEGEDDEPLVFTDTLKALDLEQAQKTVSFDSLPKFTNHVVCLENSNTYYLHPSKLEAGAVAEEEHAYKNDFYSGAGLQAQKNIFLNSVEFPNPEEFNTEIQNSDDQCESDEVEKNGDLSIREKKIMRYRAKRSKRDFSRSVNIRLSAQAQMRERDRSGHFLPSKKVSRKNKDILKLVEEQEKLREYFESTNREILALKQIVKDQQRQIEELKKQGCASNISNEITLPPSYCNSVYDAISISPSFKNMSSNSTEEAKPTLPFTVMDPSMSTKNYTSNENNSDNLIMSPPNKESINGIYHHPHEEIVGQVNFDNLHHHTMPENRLQEKLKKLGGPPSDIYHPWSNGMHLQHPVFTQKEDWQNHELRPVREDPYLSAIGRERLDYILAQQRWKQEQLLIADENRARAHAQLNSQEADTNNYWQMEQYNSIYSTEKKSCYKDLHQKEPQLSEFEVMTTIPTPTATIWREAMKNPDFRAEFKLMNDM
ncbi:uncharacterized protein LOC126326228 [Schistocerca gregaria]|uniref:uncharacterized protein LOC126326228 n=1 Tax=Schistocerca gregaria TaxID=7010 RepID=UPI00211E1C72|nr:uncharacterized protein LOC126326228 [Schistocerca gregaria]